MKFIILLSILIFPLMVNANESKVDGFLDLYYAYDLNEPSSRDRDYTTQAVRDNEFNINLVSIGLSNNIGNLSSRLSMQAGTSVQANYSSEPTTGNISGGDLSRHIQEAYINYHINDTTSVLGGIFFSHIGNETFISMDNWTYTRSLASDFSPFYESGVGIHHTLNSKWKFEGYILNGWQNISEDDRDKSIGAVIRYLKGNIEVNYSNYIGSYLGKSRHFHDLNLYYSPFQMLELKFLFDIGFQKNNVGIRKEFHTYNIQAKFLLSPQKSLTIRYEKYYDPYELNVVSVGPRGFELSGHSANLDQNLYKNLLWRIEYRRLESNESIFNKKSTLSKVNQVILTSLATKF